MGVLFARVFNVPTTWDDMMIDSAILAIFTGMPGIPEMAIVAVIILLLFGKRLPGVMRSLGSSIVEFKKGISDTGDADSEKSDSEDSGKPES
jgi:sec-independent protein translocase protein TatA